MVKNKQREDINSGHYSYKNPQIISKNYEITTILKNSLFLLTLWQHFKKPMR